MNIIYSQSTNLKDLPLPSKYISAELSRNEPATLYNIAHSIKDEIFLIKGKEFESKKIKHRIKNNLGYLQIKSSTNLNNQKTSSLTKITYIFDSILISIIFAGISVVIKDIAFWIFTITVAFMLLSMGIFLLFTFYKGQSNECIFDYRLIEKIRLKKILKFFFNKYIDDLQGYQLVLYTTESEFDFEDFNSVYLRYKCDGHFSKDIKQFFYTKVDNIISELPITIIVDTSQTYPLRIQELRHLYFCYLSVDHSRIFEYNFSFIDTQGNRECINEVVSSHRPWR